MLSHTKIVVISGFSHTKVVELSYEQKVFIVAYGSQERHLLRLWWVGVQPFYNISVWHVNAISCCKSRKNIHFKSTLLTKVFGSFLLIINELH